MADEASEISLPPTVPQPVRDRKGKGREILPPPDRKGKGREVMTAPEALFELKDVGDVSRFANQDVMFEAALKEQLSVSLQFNPSHRRPRLLRSPRASFTVAGDARSCPTDAPWLQRADYSAKGELKNMKGQSHWPWYITLVFHILNLLALDTEKGPQHLAADYMGVKIPPFPSKKPSSVLQPLTSKEISDLAIEKKALKAPVYYALPPSLYKDLEAKRSESPKWPILPKDARARFESILAKAENGTLERPWDTTGQASEEVPERGRSRSRAMAKTVPQPRPRTRASSKVSRKTVSPSQSVTEGRPTSVLPLVPSTSKARVSSQAPSGSRSVKRGPSKPRSTSKKPKKTLIQERDVPRAMRAKSVKAKKEEVVIKGTSGTGRAYVGKRPPRIMRRVPSQTDEDEVALTAVERIEVDREEIFLTGPTNPAENEPVAGPSTAAFGQTADFKSPEVPVTMERLSMALLGQRAEILEGVTKLLTNERAHIDNRIQSELYNLTETSLATLAGKWVEAGELAAKAVFNGMSEDVTDIVDKKLATFLQNVEAHIDDKINRSVKDIKQYLDERFDRHLNNTQQLPEDSSITDDPDDIKVFKNEDKDEKNVVMQSGEILDAGDASGDASQTSGSESEEGDLFLNQEVIGQPSNVARDPISLSSSSVKHPDVVSPNDSNATEESDTEDEEQELEEEEKDPEAVSLQENETNVSVDDSSTKLEVSETDTEGEVAKDDTADMAVDPDADGDGDTEEDELEEGEIDQSDDKASNSGEAMVED
ncbi:hypothetical protein QCA50_016418 [Cerrena zonata]|uniref:Uncharacterized protein n=1 Tax=Cerrena zonata TaxID=2478898 RepID=A0AAW0FIQ9_9APHY